MFIYDVLNKERVYELVSNDLRNFGVKRRPKKQTVKSEKHELNDHSFKKVFKTRLSHLPLDVVKLSSGAIVHVPQFVSQACTHIEKSITQEGLFRKAGSQLRQKEIMGKLDNGGSLGDKYQVIDVANVLKTFFRDLPEPLIPRSYHDLFLRCGSLKSHRVQALLMACILLPPHHLNTLAFFAEFLSKVAKYEKLNKMGIDNLAKVVGPSIMPMHESTVAAMHTRLEAHLATVKVLIENAEHIGILPDNIADMITAELTGSLDNDLNGSDSLLKVKHKKKKRRSGSLTRMLNGLKKMVSKSGSPDEVRPDHAVTSNQLDTEHTPSIKTGKKRKVMEPVAILGTKKKREVLRTMPDGGYPLLGNVFTPVSARDLKPSTEKLEKSKKLRLSLDRLVSKSKQVNEMMSAISANDQFLRGCNSTKITDSEIDVCKVSTSPRIERRWSSVSGVTWSKKKIRRGTNDLPTNIEESASNDRENVFMDADINLSDDGAAERASRKLIEMDYNIASRSMESSLDDNQRTEFTANVQSTDEEYVTIPKSEYEEIKSRVSAIESRISQEFGCISNSTSTRMEESSASKVQSEYEKTLEEAGIGSTTTADNLAKRLSRELKIRRSTEHKIIRSPSARKIGILRRRSQERPNSKRCNRSISWHMSRPSSAQQVSDSNHLNNFHPKSNLRRGRPNTVYTGLAQPVLQTATSLDTLCSDETNARLDFLQKQLHALITHTVEHTEGPMSDDEMFSNKRDIGMQIGDGIKSAKVRRASSVRGPMFIDNSKSFNAEMNDLKTPNGRGSRAAKNDIAGCGLTDESMSEKTVKWKDADNYFKLDNRTRTPAPQTGRASVAKLRAQNVGMVMAKAKLFDDAPKNSVAKQIYCGDENSRLSESVRRQSVKMGRTREAKNSSFETSSVKKAGSSRRKHSKSPKSANGKLKASQSPASSPLIKMEVTIMHGQNIEQSSEKQFNRYNGPRQNRKRLEQAKNEFNTPHNSRSKSIEFGDKNKDLDLQLQLHEIKQIISSPMEKKSSFNSILRESNVLQHNVASPCKTPHIKRPLAIRTPKEAKTMMRKHAVDSRRTPMKAVPSTPTNCGSDQRRSPRNARKSKQFNRVPN